LPQQSEQFEQSEQSEQPEQLEQSEQFFSFARLALAASSDPHSSIDARLPFSPVIHVLLMLLLPRDKKTHPPVLWPRLVTVRASRAGRASAFN